MHDLSAPISNKTFSSPMPLELLSTAGGLVWEGMCDVPMAWLMHWHHQLQQHCIFQISIVQQHMMTPFMFASVSNTMPGNMPLFHTMKTQPRWLNLVFLISHTKFNQIPAALSRTKMTHNAARETIWFLSICCKWSWLMGSMTTNMWWLRHFSYIKVRRPPGVHQTTNPL